LFALRILPTPRSDRPVSLATLPVALSLAFEPEDIGVALGLLAFQRRARQPLRPSAAHSHAAPRQAPTVPPAEV
jgi:hypothetical protein